VAAPVDAEAAAPVDSAAEPTGSEAAQSGDLTHRAPRATVEEAEDE